MKRFWDRAEISAEADGFAVRLDGRPVRLPGGAPLRLASRALAEAVAAEWAAAGGAKGGEMRPADVPLTRLAGTAQERLAEDPSAQVTGLLRYAETDLLCYRAEDRALAARQTAEWQPLLDWSALQLDAPLRVTVGVMPVAQPADSLAALRRAVAAEDAIGLVALGILVPVLGSLVLGLAVLRGRLEVAAAHALATLDERFQEEFWGLDAATLARRRQAAKELTEAARLLALARAAAR